MQAYTSLYARCMYHLHTGVDGKVLSKMTLSAFDAVNSFDIGPKNGQLTDQKIAILLAIWAGVMLSHVFVGTCGRSMNA